MEGDPLPTGLKLKPSRRRSREVVLQGVYQWLLLSQPADVRGIGEHLSELDPDGRGEKVLVDQTYFESLFYGTLQCVKQLDEAISLHLDRKISELSPVEHSILLLSAFELEKCPDVPYRVVINEAVELAKTFGGTDGHKYVNSILDRIAARARASEVSACRRVPQRSA